MENEMEIKEPLEMETQKESKEKKEAVNVKAMKIRCEKERKKLTKK